MITHWLPHFSSAMFQAILHAGGHVFFYFSLSDSKNQQVARLLAENCKKHFCYHKSNCIGTFFSKKKVNLRSTDNNILYDPISQNSRFWLSVTVCAELQYVWISFGPFVKQTSQQYRRQETKHWGHCRVHGSFSVLGSVFWHSRSDGMDASPRTKLKCFYYYYF